MNVASITSAVFAILLTLALGLAPRSARADGEDVDYDAIVNELGSQQKILQQRARTSGRGGRGDFGAAGTSQAQMPGGGARESGLDDVLIHAGVGVSNMFGTLAFADGSHTFLNERGVQVSLGIDLLDPQWIAEGSARSFSDADYAHNGVSVKEFDLKVLFRPRIAENAFARVGGGISGRYMSVDRGALGFSQYSTPASVAVAGFDVYLSPMFSLGGEASVRSALVADTVDQLTYDATLRMDAHF